MAFLGLFSSTSSSSSFFLLQSLGNQLLFGYFPPGLLGRQIAEDLEKLSVVRHVPSFLSLKVTGKMGGMFRSSLESLSRTKFDLLEMGKRRELEGRNLWERNQEIWLRQFDRRGCIRTCTKSQRYRGAQAISAFFVLCRIKEKGIKMRERERKKCSLFIRGFGKS